jgi:two-component system copper resistance phosphate regulon response regulator CusR
MGIRVLIVEDEDEIADYLVRGLREEGFTVERAIDGNEGWYRIETAAWDVVLLDWWLPGADGLTLLRRLRQTDAATPVLMLTARGAVSDRVRGLDAGANDYLCKPFAFDELLARIRAAMRRPEGNGRTTVAFADVRIELSTQRAERAGNRLDLTAKEYSLLLYMLRNAGQVLSRTQLYEGVWDDRYDGHSNTLEVHVAELRRKLEVHGSRLIHTLRNRGYVFGELPG